MKIIKLLIAVFVAYFFTIFGNVYAQELCEECLDNVPQDMRDWTSPNPPPWTIGYAST